METLINLLNSIPLWILILAGAIILCVAAALWIAQVLRLRRFRAELDRNLFKVLQSALRKPKLLRHIKESISAHGLRALALSCPGETFDAAANLALFPESLDEIREIAGDPEWTARYYAINLLLHDDSDRSFRTLLDALSDSHPLIRKTVLNGLPAARVEDMYERLHTALINDPVFEVREAAWKRISEEFADRYTLEAEKLDSIGMYHVLDFLDSSRDEHLNLAISLLDGENLELRYSAAVFLSQCNWLQKTLNDADLGDQEDFKRRLRLLSNAAEVQVFDFIEHTAAKPGSLMLAMHILEQRGDASLVPVIVEKAFSAAGSTSASGNSETLWKEGVLLLNTRHTERGLLLLTKELDRNRYNDKHIRFLLKELRLVDDQRIANTLMQLLQDSTFTARDALIEAAARMEIGLLVPSFKRILQAGRKSYPHAVRISALKILAASRLPYMVQMILEMLPTLPLDEARDFTAILKDYANEDFSRRIDRLLEQPDGKIRAAILSSIPLDEKKRIIKVIRAAVKDVEPEVRIAAVWALIEIEETKTLNQSLDLLRDPVAKVREAAARAMGRFGSEKTLDQLFAVLQDENEVRDVRLAAIHGMGESDNAHAVELLLSLLHAGNIDKALNSAVFEALSSRPVKERISFLLEFMKDSEAETRDNIVQVFVLMGQEVESAVSDLLEEDIQGLKPYLVEILEQTGFIESVIRRLGNRDPRLRISAANFLAKVGSVSAFRGIVLAARDPDEDVRVQVTKALEYLASESGREILHSLQKDPQPRVRRYTAWALQRLASRAMQDR